MTLACDRLSGAGNRRDFPATPKHAKKVSSAGYPSSDSNSFSCRIGISCHASPTFFFFFEQQTCCPQFHLCLTPTTFHSSVSNRFCNRYYCYWRLQRIRSMLYSKLMDHEKAKPSGKSSDCGIQVISMFPGRRSRFPVLIS